MLSVSILLILSLALLLCCYYFLTILIAVILSVDLANENKSLMQRWFNVIHEKSQLFRYESELMVRAKELELEDRHARSVKISEIKIFYVVF